MHKKLLFILTLILFATASLFAQDEDYFEFPYVSKKTIRLTAAENERVNEFTIHSEYDWQIEHFHGSTDWFEVSPTSGKKGTTCVKVKLISDNESFDSYSRLRFSTLSIVNAEGADFFPSITVMIEQYSSFFDIQETISDRSFNGYCKQFDLNGDGQLSISEAKEVERIDASGLDIISLNGLSYFENLRSLKCQDNALTLLDCSENNQLEYVDCSDNQISGSVFFGPNMMLREINCSNNRIEELYPPMSPSFRALDCKNNKIRKLSIDFIRNIQYVDCSDNDIEDINLSYAKNLKKFDCSNNPVRYIYVKDLEYPQKLDYFAADPQAIVYTDVRLRDEIEPRYEVAEEHYQKALGMIENYLTNNHYNREERNDCDAIKLLTDSLNQITGKSLSWRELGNNIENMIPHFLAFNISLPDPQKVDNVSREELTEIVRRILSYKIPRYVGHGLQESYYNYTLGENDYHMNFLRRNFKTFDEALFEKIETPTKIYFKLDENLIVERLWNKGNH